MNQEIKEIFLKKYWPEYWSIRSYIKHKIKEGLWSLAGESLAGTKSWGIDMYKNVIWHKSWTKITLLYFEHKR